MNIDIDQVYSDLDFKFRKLVSGDFNLVKNENAIKQSLMSLFYTRRGERIFNPNYGTDLPNQLFEPFDESTANVIVEEIRLGINTWEGRRVKIDKIAIDLDYDNLIYYVSIDYTILSTTATDTLNFNLKKL
jgi:phage baseplate assembly protein W